MSQAQTLPTEHFPPSVSLIEGRPATTSLAIAECFGKRHDDVTKSIRNLHANCPEEFRARNFAETFRTVAGPNNSQRQEKFFTVYFDGFILLVMGYTGKKALQMKLAYIEAFNAMKEQIDKLAEQERARLAEPVRNPDRLTSTDSLSTAASRKPLRALVHAWAQISGTPHTALWPQVKAHFQLERIDDLPEEWIPDALEWVQGKIDSLHFNKRPWRVGLFDGDNKDDRVEIEKLDDILPLADRIRATARKYDEAKKAKGGE